MTLAEKISNAHVDTGEIALFYLAQAGFCVKTSNNTLIGIDLYLSDCCEKMFGFKRLIPPPISAAELDLNILASTHSHADHLDPESLSVFGKNPKTLFVGSPDCETVFKETNIAESRYKILTPGESTEILDTKIRATYADHGELSPDAMGLILNIDGVTIYHTGDTALRPKEILASLETSKIDVMIVPINGTFGNLNVAEACELAEIVKPRIVIASHFGMFAEHGETSGKDFIDYAKTLNNRILPLVMTPGEMLTILRDDQ